MLPYKDRLPYFTLKIKMFLVSCLCLPMSSKLQLQLPAEKSGEKYGDWNKNQLIEEIERLRKRKKYGLVWEDKPEEVVERCKSELPILHEVATKQIASDKVLPTNILIEGDNYHALSVLNYTHKGKIDFIYIDPPYNTGARDWKYNNDYVDAEDAYRHTKWLSFMSHRLKLAKNLLSPDGIICVAIDDYELFTLGLLMDDSAFFGEKNRIGVICVEHNPQGRSFSRFFSTTHEYYLFYAKDINKIKIENLPIFDELDGDYSHEDSVSRYKLIPLRKSGFASRRTDRPTQYYPIYLNEKTLKLSMEKQTGWKAIYPINTSGEECVWRISLANCKKFVAQGDIEVKKTNGNYVLYKKHRIEQGKKATTMWVHPKYAASMHGASLITKILGKQHAFNYPKSLHAVKDAICVALANKKDATVLDFFAGSGTTAHAVLQLNNEDDGNRRFIICTNDENQIASEVCYPRVARVIKGYTEANGEKIPGLGGNLKYFKTAFVGAEPNDKNKEVLTREATEMLCMREDTFEAVKETKLIKIFKGNKRHTGIVFDEDAIPALKKEIEKIGGRWSVYIFSLSDDTFDEEFEDMKKSVVVAPIPEAILRVYRRIFQK